MKQRIIVPITVLAVVTSTGCDLFKTRFEEIPPEFPDTVVAIDTADLSWTFRDLQGDTVTLAEFAGKRMFINIWGTWCQPCLVELPHLQHLYDEMKSDTAIAFFFISDEADSTVRAFAREAPYTLPFYVSDAYKPRPYNTGRYPTTIIVNSAGGIVYRRALTADWSDPSVAEFLRTLE